MKIPVGDYFIENKRIEDDSAIQDLLEALREEKTGYFCLSVKGRTGVEEGLFIFDKGRVIGAHYDYMNYESEYKAEKALKRCLNALNADKGIYDAFKVSGEQMELLKTFNEDFLLLEPRKKERIDASIPMSFSYEYEEEEVEEEAESREEVMKKYGIPNFEAKTKEEQREELKKKMKTEEISAEDLESKVDRYLEED